MNNNFPSHIRIRNGNVFTISFAFHEQSSKSCCRVVLQPWPIFAPITNKATAAAAQFSIKLFLLFLFLLRQLMFIEKFVFGVFLWNFRELLCLNTHTQQVRAAPLVHKQTINKYTFARLAILFTLVWRKHLLNAHPSRSDLVHFTGASSHHFTFIEHVCDQIICIHHGWQTRWLNIKWEILQFKITKAPLSLAHYEFYSTSLFNIEIVAAVRFILYSRVGPNKAIC